MWQLGEKGVIKDQKKKPPENLEKQRKSGVTEAMREKYLQCLMLQRNQIE